MMAVVEAVGTTFFGPFLGLGRGRTLGPRKRAEEARQRIIWQSG
jgi:hypothetical protein